MILIFQLCGSGLCDLFQNRKPEQMGQVETEAAKSPGRGRHKNVSNWWEWIRHGFEVINIGNWAHSCIGHEDNIAVILGNDWWELEGPFTRAIFDAILRTECALPYPAWMLCFYKASWDWKVCIVTNLAMLPNPNTTNRAPPPHLLKWPAPVLSKHNLRH